MGTSKEGEHEVVSALGVKGMEELVDMLETFKFQLLSRDPMVWLHPLFQRDKLHLIEVLVKGRGEMNKKEEEVMVVRVANEGLSDAEILDLQERLKQLRMAQNVDAKRIEALKNENLVLEEQMKSLKIEAEVTAGAQKNLEHMTQYFSEILTEDEKLMVLEQQNSNSTLPPLEHILTMYQQTNSGDSSISEKVELSQPTPVNHQYQFSYSPDSPFDSSDVSTNLISMDRNFAPSFTWGDPSPTFGSPFFKRPSTPPLLGDPELVANLANIDLCYSSTIRQKVDTAVDVGHGVLNTTIGDVTFREIKSEEKVKDVKSYIFTPSRKGLHNLRVNVTITRDPNDLRSSKISLSSVANVAGKVIELKYHCVQVFHKYVHMPPEERDLLSLNFGMQFKDIVELVPSFSAISEEVANDVCAELFDHLKDQLK